MLRGPMGVLERVKQLAASVTWHVRPVMSRANLWVQLLAVFLVLFAVAFGGTTYLFYRYSTDQAMTVLRNDLNGSAADLAAHLNAATVARIHTVGQMDADYRAVQSQLLYLVASDPKIFGAYIFTRNPQDAKTLLWIDTSNLHPHCKCNVTRNAPYDPATHAPEMFGAFQHPTTSPNIYTDVYGSWLSGYAPIRDAGGHTVAIAEVDMTAQSVINVQNNIRDASWRVFLIVLLCLLAVIPLMAAIITNPLKLVTVAARSLELGRTPDRTGLQRATQGRDEVSQLARVFGRMADEVQSREEKLKRQVEDLKIEVDIAKQQKEVAEITDTDFFRQLQQKAQRMRARLAEPGQILPAT